MIRSTDHIIIFTALLLCVVQRHQVHQRNVLVSSLQQQLRKVTEVQAAKQHQQQGREGGNVTQEAAKLKDSNARLEEELWRMKERNRKLEEVGKDTLSNHSQVVLVQRWSLNGGCHRGKLER